MLSFPQTEHRRFYRRSSKKTKNAGTQEQQKRRSTMVVLIPLDDFGCSSEPEAVRDDQEPGKGGAGEEEERRAGEVGVKNPRKRKYDSDSIPGPANEARRSPEPVVRSEPAEAPRQELPGAQAREKKRRKPSTTTNIFRKLERRELGFPVSFSREKFRGVKEVQLLDLFMFKNSAALEEFEPFMRIRSPISKIIPLQDMLVLLSRTGVCGTLSRVTNDMITFLTRAGEMTEDIFYNKIKKALIIASSCTSHNNSEKTYRSIPIGLLRTQDNTGNRIFESEQVQLLIEFDATNGLALLRDRISHRIFDLSTYSLLYKLPEPDIANVLCGKNLLTLVIKLIESGDDIGYIYHPTEGKLELLQVFHHKILIKERFKVLHMIDVKKSDIKDVPIGIFKYHPLYGRNCFLTFQNESSQIRNLNGDVIKELENTLWKSTAHEHRICSSSNDDTVIYVAESKASKLGTVNICSLGAEVSISTVDPEVEVTCLSYNEDLHEIYLGTSGGRVYVYSV